ncbi:ArsR family transcriptional regulator [Lysinibacillus sp. NPDC097214]|uniref:ArsR family transcriptional regulator n=1 Tax=Lysinibacillus sp. NPDC097214 TaxID=3390584 RepID=UPI003D055033
MTETTKQTPAIPATQAALPFETKGWAALPHALMEIYTLHPDFNANTALVYTYLVKNYNRSYGYSFPTFDEMELVLNVSRSTVDKAIETLRKLQVINATKHPYYGNNVYTFNPLIETVEEFARAFSDEPEIAKRITRNKARREKLRTRKDAFKWKPGDAV